MERVIRERMTLQAQDMDVITPQALINIRPVVAAIKGVLRLLSPFPVHGSEQPPGGADPQAPPLGPRARRLVRDRAGFEVGTCITAITAVCAPLRPRKAPTSA